MANDGQIVFEVTADGKHAIADIKEITRAIQTETGKWDAAAKQSADGIEGKFSGMLKKLAAGFSAVKIGQALLSIGKDALSAASDLQEVQNVVDVTFGENASKVEAWAKTASSSFGLTETQAKRFSSTMGAMLKSSGLAGDEIVNVSTDLAGLAADMASFYNLDFDEAFSKIRSGISGQTMPLKELGIDMSVATLNAFALKQGLDKTFDQMSQGEQTMLRYQYLMQATSDAQGDFARTSDGYANSIRQLESNVDALKAALGQSFIDVVAGAVGSLNEFLGLLLPDESKRTVLDDFADIDLNTEQKIEQIRETATEARLLTDELDKIGGSKADQAGSKVQQLATDLSNINLDQGKAGIVKDFISTLANNVGLLADLTGKDAEGAQEWLNGIAESANKLDDDDAKGWIDLVNAIKEGLPGIENTDFGSSFFAALGAGFESVGEQSSVLQWAVETLGDKTNKTAEEQALWLETCKRLVQTIPGLSSIINTETGEVKGGTQAIKDYVQAWEDGQVKLAMLGALEQKKSAVSERFANLPGLQLDMAVAERRAREQQKKLQELQGKYGLGDVGYTQDGKVYRDWGRAFGITAEDKKLLDEAADELEKLEDEAAEAAEAYKTQKAALEEAETALQEYADTIDEMPGEVEQAVDESEKFWSDNAEAISTMVENAKVALNELGDYVQGVHDSVEQSVSSTVKGFEKIKSPMMQAQEKTKDLTAKLNKLSERTNKNAKEWDKLNEEINQYNGQKISSQGMAANLKQQAEYMETYLANLRKAREMGVSDELLAQLSDGSGESYDYLAALAEASPGEVEEINKNFQAVIDKKKELTDELTNQQLSVDDTYKSLQEKAKEAVDALDMEELAGENTGKTVKGAAEGIKKHLPEVTEAVDAIIAQIDRLSGVGIQITTTGLGGTTTTTSVKKPKFQTDGITRAFASGIDYVPYDMVARIHEGEKILNAQEAAMYRSILNGGLSGVDLDALGGVMRDNVKPGGNVYLDGKIVGSVVSSVQGRAYKSLNRSGWQA